MDIEQLAPMLLAPIAKGRAWGGDTFVGWKKFASVHAGALPIGESWELADLPDSIAQGCSQIDAGAFAGSSLREALHANERAIMGRAHLSAEGRFPLLVKFLDAAENLSVQVHPNIAFAQANANAHLKTESWFVLHAKPGAHIWRGVRASVTRAEFERALRAGEDIVKLLVEVPVKAGDCIELPSGLCHALGEGITVAEIQTPSDTTFRVFDWNRRDAARPLHIEQAMACIAFGEQQQLDRIPVVNANEVPPVLTRHFRTTLLTRTSHYRIERLEALDQIELPVVTHQRPVCWMVLAGEVQFHLPQQVTASTWRSLLIPAAADGVVAHLSKGASLLRASVPDPMDGWIA